MYKNTFTKKDFNFKNISMKVNCHLPLSIAILATILACKSNLAQNNASDYRIEQHRPQYHFTPQTSWMNDPNGMVYYAGEYHLFYQYFPDTTVWGPMHWGHALSKDMLHWEHLPIALYPDKTGCIFSGSAVVDKENTSGFGTKGGENPLVAMFTLHDLAGEKIAGKIDIEVQGIAYSLDKGRTWAKYAQNPVIKNPNIRDFRDPKLMWHEASKKWIVTLAVANHVEFYSSKNLKDWQKAGGFGSKEGAHGGVWECPDLFPIKVEGTNEEKWVLMVSIGDGAPNGRSGTQYFVGDFDGKTFKNENIPDNIFWIDYGRDNYAGVTWSNAPDNRRLFLGWMSNWQYAQNVPTQKWRSAMTLPRELFLKKTAQGNRLFQVPVKEISSLENKWQSIEKQVVANTSQAKNYSKCGEIYLEFDLSKSTAKDFGLTCFNAKGEKISIGYETATKRFYIDRTVSGKLDFEPSFSGRHYAPRTATDNKLVLHLFIDVASVELFADNGQTAVTDIFFPNEDFTQFQLFSNGGNAALNEGKMTELKAMW